ncbi:MAG TPA: hypothetical protein VFO81_03400 [Gaiellaceae bacterium]|nr:hypothetical protein [Gaiellaceae bacterium]
MSIVNRRNALIGWLTWLTAKRMVKKKAKDAVPGTVEGTKRPNRGAIISAVVAVGGALWFWRRKSGDDSDAPDDSAAPEA